MQNDQIFGNLTTKFHEKSLKLSCWSCRYLVFCSVWSSDKIWSRSSTWQFGIHHKSLNLKFSVFRCKVERASRNRFLWWKRKILVLLRHRISTVNLDPYCIVQYWATSVFVWLPDGNISIRSQMLLGTERYSTNPNLQSRFDDSKMPRFCVSIKGICSMMRKFQTQ